MPKRVILDFPCSETFRRYEESLNGEPSPPKRLTPAEEQKLSTCMEENVVSEVRWLTEQKYTNAKKNPAKQPTQRKDRGAGGINFVDC